jgi:hypothetical protein
MQQEESVRMPDGERFDKKPIFKRVIKATIFSVVGSLLGGLILSGPNMWKATRYTAGAIVKVSGNPVDDEDGIIGKAEKKLDAMEKRIEQKVEKGPHLPAAGLAGVGHATPEQLKAKAELEEAERIRKEQSERRELEARAERIGLKHDKEWTLEKLRLAVQDAERELKEINEKEQEEEKKKPLLARADAIKLIVDKTLPYKELKKVVEKGEHKFAANGRNQSKLRQYEKNLEVRKYLVEHGPNARCPNPKCHYQWRTNRKDGQFICPKCRGLFNITQAKANMPPPPMPAYPRLEDTNGEDPNLLDRVKDILGR